MNPEIKVQLFDLYKINELGYELEDPLFIDSVEIIYDLPHCRLQSQTSKKSYWLYGVQLRLETFCSLGTELMHSGVIKVSGTVWHNNQRLGESWLLVPTSTIIRQLLPIEE